MRRVTTSLIAVGAIAGLAGAVLTYRSTAGGVAEPPVSAAAAAPAADPVTKLLPCEKDTKLVRGVCIRTKHRVVVREIVAASPIQITSPTRPAGSERDRDRGTNKPRNNTPRDPASPEDDSEPHDEGEHESEDEHDQEPDEHELED